ncbi:MAG: dephospho-CoA kinase [Rhizobiales bacterium 24-66-13]|jgi:dephospho-CoA kinase|nr:MAG: dephospho-CoA kinase [Rhizobiales bacterium 24-66-13]HQS08822.1 dephospho-CoA kinase [Xanthobacteraceae bacterium]HQS45359.1 dephospho-CoA kinase [Xanthobacteraceae bacterium]
MWILGLTGSIGMGKSATAGLFRAEGVPVYDADAAVHALYRGEAVAPVEAAFPGVTRDGVIDRPALSARVLGDAAAMKRLEAIVHPLVRAQEMAFLAKARAAGARLVVLDIPLLFETGGERRVHAVAVVSAPAAVQKRRVLERSGMTPERFEAILAKQLPDSLKRTRAHFLIDTGRGFDSARHQVRGIVRALSGPGRRPQVRD